MTESERVQLRDQDTGRMRRRGIVAGAEEVRAPAPGVPLRRVLDLISHELRTPLNVIQSWTHVLENELSRTLGEESGRNVAPDASPAALRALAGIRTGVREQVRLIDQMLEASRAINGAMTIERRPLAILPVLEGALFVVQPQAMERQIRLRADYAAPDVRVDGDEERLRQALVHLLSNAISFSSEHTEVHVRLRREVGDVVVSITDQGAGVSPDARREVFDWFRKGGRSKGLGLGLSLARHVAREHGGDVELESGEGGATFSLRLPAWEFSEEPVSAPRGDRAARADRSSRAGPTPRASND